MVFHAISWIFRLNSKLQASLPTPRWQGEALEVMAAYHLSENYLGLLKCRFLGSAPDLLNLLCMKHIFNTCLHLSSESGILCFKPIFTLLVRDFDPRNMQMDEHSKPNTGHMRPTVAY